MDDQGLIQTFSLIASYSFVIISFAIVTYKSMVEGFFRLEDYANGRGFSTENLSQNQKNSIRNLASKRNVFVVTPTNSGKSIIGYICLWLALIRGMIGAYLVPTTELLKEKMVELSQFFGDGVSIITLSGEKKPTVKELRRAKGRLIIVSTYEAFRSFLFSIKKHEYFKARKVFGGVVIDEVHYLADRSRGARLETLIYKLQREHDSQCCFLSATFDGRAARYWANRFNAKLIFQPLRRRFKLEKIVEKPSLDIATKSNMVVTYCGNILNKVITEDVVKNPENVSSKHVLIFCYSRKAAERISADLNFKLGDKTKVLGNFWSCGYIHAGLDSYSKHVNISDFKKTKGIRILCCSPIIEAGIDIRDVDTVVITDAEIYSGIELNQMIGRIRARTGTVLHFVYKGVDQKTGKTFKGLLERKMILDPHDKSIILGYKMERVRSQIGLAAVPKLVMERLFRSMAKLSGIREHLKKLLPPKIYRASKDIIPEFMAYLKQKKLAREDKGQYGLTLIGDACVENQLPIKHALKLVKFFKKNREPTARACQAVVSEITGKMQDKTNKKLITYDSNLPIKWPAWKKNVASFIEKFSDDPDKNAALMNDLDIRRGDAETLRRTAEWIISSSLSIYRGLLAHEEALKNKTYHEQVLQMKEEKGEIVQRIERVIKRFQVDPNVNRKKPRIRQRSTKCKGYSHAEILLLILERVKEKGATINEFVTKINEYVEETSSIFSAFLKYDIKKSTIRSTLAKELKTKVGYIKVRGPRGAPAHRYFLKEYMPKMVEKYTCKECEFYKYDTIRLSYYCDVTDEEVFAEKPACDDIKPKISKFKLMSKFKKGKFGPLCPGCGKEKCIRIPAFNELIICNNCEVLIRRTKKARFIIKWGTEIPDSRILIGLDGIKYVPVDANPKIIFLSTGNALKIDRNKALSIIQVDERVYFIDEVKLIILAGGSMDLEDRTFLEQQKIGFVEYSEAKIKKTDEQAQLAELLREAIRKMRQAPEVLRLIKQLIYSKVITNILLTYKFGDLMRKDDFIEECNLKQLDFIAKSCLDEREEIPTFLLHFLFRKSGRISKQQITSFTSIVEAIKKKIPKLRSAEGNAERKAWQPQKKALPNNFQISKRQKLRFLRSELYGGAKAFDPYNAALNYLYYLLQQKAAGALGAAGFSKYYPGPGFLHSREKLRTPKELPVERKQNRELIFDFMDAYRPVFRHELGAALRRGELTKSDIEHDQDEWKRTVYFIPEGGSGAKILEGLFTRTCKNEYVYDGQKLPLSEIMMKEARLLARHLLTSQIPIFWMIAFFFQRERKKYVTFRAFESQDEEEEMLARFRIIENILCEEKERIISPVLKPKKRELEDTVPKLDVLKPEMPTNVAIVVHGDADGFKSAAYLTVKHFKNTQLKIIIADDTTGSRHHINDVLRDKLPNHLLKNCLNLVYISDLPLDEYGPPCCNSLRTHVGDMGELHVWWFDHHANVSQSAIKEFQESGFEFTHSISKEAHELVRNFISQDLAPEQVEMFKHVDHHVGNNTRFFKAALGKFESWVKDRDNHRWDLFFKKTCNPEMLEYKKAFKVRKIEKKKDIYLFHYGVRASKCGRKFAVFLFRKPFNVKKVPKLLRQFNYEVDFALVYFYDHTFSIRNYDWNWNFNFLHLFESQERIILLGWEEWYEKIKIKVNKAIVGHAGALNVKMFHKVDYRFEKKAEIEVAKGKSVVIKNELHVWEYFSYLNFDAAVDLFEKIDFTDESKVKPFKYKHGYKLIRIRGEEHPPSMRYANEYTRSGSELLTKIDRTHFPISIQTLDEVFLEEDGKVGFFRTGHTYYILGFMTERWALKDFICYVMLASQSVQDPPPVILCIDTLEDNYYDALFKFFTIHDEFTTRNVENIHFTKIRDEGVLYSAIEELERVIKLSNAKIVIVNSLFHMIKTLHRPDATQNFQERTKISAYLSARISDLANKLRTIARKLDACVIMTHYGDKRDIIIDKNVRKIKYFKAAYSKLDYRLLLELDWDKYKMDKKEYNWKVTIEKEELSEFASLQKTTIKLQRGNFLKLKLNQFSNLPITKTQPKLKES